MSPWRIIAEMLSQSNMSGLGVLLIVNKACIHSRACVVQSMFGKNIFQNMFSLLEISGEGTLLHCKI